MSPTRPVRTLASRLRDGSRSAFRNVSSPSAASSRRSAATRPGEPFLARCNASWSVGGTASLRCASDDADRTGRSAPVSCARRARATRYSELAVTRFARALRKTEPKLVQFGPVEDPQGQAPARRLLEFLHQRLKIAPPVQNAFAEPLVGEALRHLRQHFLTHSLGCGLRFLNLCPGSLQPPRYPPEIPCTLRDGQPAVERCAGCRHRPCAPRCGCRSSRRHRSQTPTSGCRCALPRAPRALRKRGPARARTRGSRSSASRNARDSG